MKAVSFFFFFSNFDYKQEKTSHIYLLCYFLFYFSVVESLSQDLGISMNLNKPIYHLIIKTIKTLSFSIKIKKVINREKKKLRINARKKKS